jgi:DNA-binding XRE family transcriptional regulator
MAYEGRSGMSKSAMEPKSIGKQLQEFRVEFELTKTAMVDLFKKYGLGGVNWSTYHKWEKEANKPRPLYEDAIKLALTAARPHLELEKAKRK